MKNEKFENFLVIYFDFAYFLLFSPFRVVFSSEYKSFCITKWWPQKYFCGLLSSLGYLSTLYQFHRTLTKTSTSNRTPSFYFEIVSIIFAVFLHAFTHKLFYFEQEKILYIINFLNKHNLKSCSSFTNQNEHFWQRKFVWQLVCLFHSILIIYDISELIGFNNGFDKITVDQLVQRAHKVFFYVDLKHRQEKYWLVDYFLAILVALVWISQYISAQFISLAILYSVVTVWSPSHFLKIFLSSNNFKDLNSETLPILVNGSEGPFEKLGDPNKDAVLQDYQAIKKLASLVSGTFGSMLTCYMGHFIMTLSRNMDGLVFTPNWRMKIEMLQYISVATVSLILAAEIPINVIIKHSNYIRVNC